MSRRNKNVAEQVHDEAQTEHAVDQSKGTEQVQEALAPGGAAPKTDEAPAAPKSNKSIVPSKYAGKYKNSTEALAAAINTECKGEDGEFSFPKFFDLCGKNGVPADKVAHYEKLVASNAGGARGRARMTLRNMLEPRARKAGKLVKLDGSDFEIAIPERARTGVTAKAEETTAAE